MQFLYAVGLLNPWKGWEIIGLASLIMVCVLAAMAIASGNFRRANLRFSAIGNEPVWKVFFAHLYPIWGIAQQLLFFSALYGMRSLFPGVPWIDLLAALLLAVCHFPNTFLMWPTAFMAMIFIQHMDVYHNVFAVGVAHGLIGTAYFVLSPKAIPATFAIFGGYLTEQRELNAKLG